jgi:hypothetical protein
MIRPSLVFLQKKKKMCLSLTTTGHATTITREKPNFLDEYQSVAFKMVEDERVSVGRVTDNQQQQQ